MSASFVAGNAHGRSQLPFVNLFDVPEMMPGARASANPAQRMEFEQRCRKLYEEELAEQLTRGSEAIPTVEALESMFPCLEPGLVKALAAEAPTAKVAMETLMSLVASMAEPARPCSAPKDLGLEDAEAFPSLLDADGWQVASHRQLERDFDEDLGSAWCERAKAIAAIPQQQAKSQGMAAAPNVAMSKRRASRKGQAGLEKPLPEIDETDYEYRQRLGKEHARNRVRFSKGVKAVASRSTEGACDSNDVQSGETSSEESQDGEEQ